MVSWHSHAQMTVALFSIEAEYMAISNCSWQAIWIETLIEELGSRLKAVSVHGDNQGSIFIASNPVTLCKRATQSTSISGIIIPVKLLVLRRLKLCWCPREMNPTDMFTKNLGKIKFLKLQNQLGLDFEDSPNPPANLLWCLHCLKWHAALTNTKHGGVLNKLQCAL